MTEFKIRTAKIFGAKLTSRIQKTGKLGFGEKECRLMNLQSGVYIGFVSTDEAKVATHLVVKREKDEDCFELKKANTCYPAVDTKQLFDFFGYNYVDEVINLDLTRDEALDGELGGEVYRVSERRKMKSNNEETEDDADEE